MINALSCFVIPSGCIFNGFKCPRWHQRKHFWSLFLMLISPFFWFFNSAGNLGKGLKVEMLMYWEWIFSIIQPNPSLTHLSMLIKFLEKLFQDQIYDLSLFLLLNWNRLEEMQFQCVCIFNKILTVIWHFDTFCFI